MAAGQNPTPHDTGIGGGPGPAGRRFGCVQCDRAYDSNRHRIEIAAPGMRAIFGRRNTEYGSGLGVFRCVMERTTNWLHQFRRLRVRYERRADTHEAFLTLGCIVLCFRALER